MKQVTSDNGDYHTCGQCSGHKGNEMYEKQAPRKLGFSDLPAHFHDPLMDVFDEAHNALDMSAAGMPRIGVTFVSLADARAIVDEIKMRVSDILLRGEEKKG